MAETGTQFSVIYNRFLSKITEDMYMEITPEETINDLQAMLIEAIPGFEFPRICLTDYTIETKILKPEEVTGADFIIGQVWHEISELGEQPDVVVDYSRFAASLTSEEINILANLMVETWAKRQLYSIEVTRMKYSGADFKMTSQANHLAKLENLRTEARREAFHMQRLYKRRRLDRRGHYHSNWTVLRERSAIK